MSRRDRADRHCMRCDVLWAGSAECWVCGGRGRLRDLKETLLETLAWPS